jgi:hypothetical protein
MNGIELIAQEREEQIKKHGFNVYKDKKFYRQFELRRAAMWTLTFDEDYYPESWGLWFRERMDLKRRRMSGKELDIERLKIAGALIAAEIDRLQLSFAKETETV